MRSAASTHTQVGLGCRDVGRPQDAGSPTGKSSLPPSNGPSPERNPCTRPRGNARLDGLALTPPDTLTDRMVSQRARAATPLRDLHGRGRQLVALTGPSALPGARVMSPFTAAAKVDSDVQGTARRRPGRVSWICRDSDNRHRRWSGPRARRRRGASPAGRHSVGPGGADQQGSPRRGHPLPPDRASHRRRAPPRLAGPRRRALQAAQRRRAGHQQAQGLPRGRHPLRQARRRFRGTVDLASIRTWLRDPVPRSEGHALRRTVFRPVR